MKTYASLPKPRRYNASWFAPVVRQPIVRDRKRLKHPRLDAMARGALWLRQRVRQAKDSNDGE